MTRALGYTPEKVKELSKGSLEEIGSKKVHPYAWV